MHHDSVDVFAGRRKGCFIVELVHFVVAHDFGASLAWNAKHPF